MEGSDGLAGLAALSTKVRREHHILLDRLKSFEKKLLESAGGLGCYGASERVTLSTWDHEESGFSGGCVGWLFFDGRELKVATESYADDGRDSVYDDNDLNTARPRWLVLLSARKTLDSLVANISRVLEAEHTLFTTANEWLTQFVATEKAVIDADLEEHFEPHFSLLDSWQKARRAVEVDPEDSITRSSSHLETVLKACLKQLGDIGYENMPVDKLSSRMVRRLRDEGAADEGTLQSLSGLGSIFHGIGTVRNSSSTAHGKNDGYSPPSVDVAQFINHLAGTGSAFVLKQTEKLSKRRG